MNEETRKMLEEEIRTRIRNLSNIASGSEEEETAVSNVVALYKLKIEEEKNEKDFDERAKKRIEDSLLTQCAEKNRVREQIKDRYFRIGIATAELILPLMFYGVWMRKGFKFEEKGTYTSTTFRGLFNRFRPTGKQ